MAINKDTVIEDIFKLFLDQLKDRVVSVTIDNMGVANSKTITIGTYTSSNPSELLDGKASYPILSIRSTDIASGGWNTLGKESYEGIVEIELFCTNAPSADKFSSLIMKSLREARQEMFDDGLYLLRLESSYGDNFQRGGNDFNIYYRNLRYQVGFIYQKW
jgi:hypothetical protein